MKRNYIYTYILVLTLVLSGCNDYFELQRPPQVPWGNVDEFERAPIGIYATLFAGDSWNMPWVNLAMVKTNMGDDVDWVSNAEFGYWRKSKEFNKYTDKSIMVLYRAIAGANNAIEFVEQNNGNPFPTESVENIENNVNRIIGEFYFTRAYAYYIIQTTYGHAYVPGSANATPDIPMPTVFAKSVEEAKSPKIGTTQEVYDLILADLKKAKELLPEKYIEGVHHMSYQVRANKFAASAMLVRTYFQRGEYENAKKECDFIINENKGEYNLSEDPIEAFNKSTAERGKEVIFYLPYFGQSEPSPMHLLVLNHQDDQGKKLSWTEMHMGNNTIQRIGWMNDPVNDTTLSITAKRDKRFQQLFDVRYPENKHLASQDFDNRERIKTWTTIWGNKYFRGAKNKTNVPLIRLAEIYLTRSICLLRLNNKEGAAEDLNIVRSRAWDTAIGGPFVEVAESEITEQMINDERIIEMFAEADRIDYLRGLKVEIPLGERGNGAEQYTSESFVWALPVSETLYNEALM